MATSTLADQALTGAWVDLTVALGTLANADAVLQNVSNEPLAVVFGGGDPTASGKSGIILGPREKHAGNAANVWARSLGSAGIVSVILGATVAGATGSGATASQVQGNVAAGTADSGNPVKVGAVIQGAPLSQGADGARSTLKTDDRGYLWTSLGAFGGTAMGTAGAPGAAVVSVQGVAGGTALPVSAAPATSGGLPIARLVGATNGVIKASAGQLYTGTFTNTNAAIRFLQIYNKATAGTLSTDTPVLTVPLPPNVSVMIDFDAIGGAFATGISWQVTTDDIAIPTTAGSTTDIHGFATFK